MAVNEVILGAGNATGMFYTAPQGTTLPTFPGDDLSGWTEVGDINEDGITFSTRDKTTLKNWAGTPKRVIPGTDPATIKALVMDTTEDTLKTIFGASNVTVTAATEDHGKLVSVDLDSSPAPAAFLFVMKDGDAMVMVGTSDGIISELGDVSFKGSEAIQWDITVSGAWTIVTDDGQVEE